MPKQKNLTREQILEAAFELVRVEGVSGLTARALAKALGTSTSPIFGHFSSMAEMLPHLKARAEAKLREYQTTTRTGEPFLDMGLGYIDFARREPRLFWELLGNAGRANECEGREFGKTHLAAMRKDPRLAGLDDGALFSILLKMWIFVHGMASLSKADAIALGDDENIRRMLLEVGSAVIDSALKERDKK